jgi:hypothetical protein
MEVLSSAAGGHCGTTLVPGRLADSAAHDAVLLKHSQVAPASGAGASSIKQQV